jgi:hypothetical protein
VRITDITPERANMAIMPSAVGSETAKPRSPGVHVSEIIRDIENELIHVGQRRKYDTLTDAEKKRMGAYVSVGWAWEDILAQSLLKVWNVPVVPVGELHLDGIAGTPDGLNTDEYAVEEFKATWRSANRPLDPDYWHWLVQIKAYCYMLQTNIANLRIFYVCGDYRESGPFLRMHRLEFSELELQENWQMLYQHAKDKGWFKNAVTKGGSSKRKGK